MSELALELIHEAKEKRLTRLDLGKCGLVEIPESLFELVWLKELIFSDSWLEIHPHTGEELYITSSNSGQQNKIQTIPQHIKLLTELEYIDISNNEISDITPVASLKSLVSLRLSHNQISNIRPIVALSNLVVLSFHHNNVSDISPIRTLQNLRSLYLGENSISDIRPISVLNSLTSLYLFSNKISDITPIADLNNLTLLDLSHNWISDLRPIAALNKLTNLKLNRNNIIEIAPISHLRKLTSLSFFSNEISDISPIVTLTNLVDLNLSNNQISDIAPLKSLNNLHTLDLSLNGISDITGISALQNLASLNLSKNKISDISPTVTLKDLDSLDLYKNEISNITAIKNLIERGLSVQLERKRFNSLIIVGGNPLEHPPKEVIEQGNDAVLTYFKNLEEQGAEQLNEAKLIIVGEPEAGKTSLMETLLNPEFELCPDTETTLGIEVREGWKFDHPQKPDTTFITNIWDFGGQQIQYMTHQFFLTPGAAYVLVSANDRKEPTNFPYWFKIIHLLGEEKGVYSPVLVVLNEKDDKYINKFNFDLKFYQERYPELQITVREVDLSKRDGNYKALCDEVQSMLTHLPHVTHDRPARWGDIRNTLRERAKTDDHITVAQYAEICQQHAVNDEASQLLFSSYLHRLGSLLHFHDDPTLYNFIILNPQWAVDAVYSVLNDNEIARSGGYFSREQVETIWSAKEKKDGSPRYNHEERLKLLSLMEKENFEICYPLDSNRQSYIAPQLLDTEQPDYEWDAKDCLKFRFQYKFMPEGILTRLIVRLNALIESGSNERGLVWRKGVVFNSEGCRAQVLEEENRDGLKVIDIAVTGKQSQRKFLLREIRKEVQDIHTKWFRNIQSEQMIPCTCSFCDESKVDVKLFEFTILQRAQERGKATVECDKDFINVPVMGLLEGVFDKEELETQKHSSELCYHPQPPNIEVTVNNTIPTQPEPQIAQQPDTSPQKSQTPWYKEWWIISVAIAVIAGLIGGLAFLSLKIATISAVGAGIFVYFMNPKRRFYRAAWVLLLLFGSIVTPPMINGYFKYKQQPSSNEYIDFAIKVGESMDPLLTGAMAITALLGALFLFHIDSKQE